MRKYINKWQQSIESIIQDHKSIKLNLMDLSAECKCVYGKLKYSDEKSDIDSEFEVINFLILFGSILIAFNALFGHILSLMFTYSIISNIVILPLFSNLSDYYIHIK